MYIMIDVVTDAMGIYTTYIALNALSPVHVPDDIRQRVEGNQNFMLLTKASAIIWFNFFDFS